MTASTQTRQLDDAKFYTQKEAAEWLGVEFYQLRQMVCAGEVKLSFVSPSYRVAGYEIRRALANQEPVKKCQP